MTDKKAGEKIIILVTDQPNGKQGEISVIDEPSKAERIVEKLLEAGFDQERIRVFSGRASDFQVSQRPVVALVAEGATEPVAPTVHENGNGSVEEVPTEAAPPPQSEEVNGASEPVAASSEDGAPVRFSSLFRSA